MGHARKPGTPRKTTIPPDVVSRVTERLLREFRRFHYDVDHHLFVVPQQCYLYLEVRWKREDDDDPHPPVTKSSTTHKPLGRLKYLGQVRKWEFHPYRWSISWPSLASKITGNLHSVASENTILGTRNLSARSHAGNLGFERRCNATRRGLSNGQ